MASRQRTKSENRRRSGCHQCKDKHVRCTEEKPHCRRCERLGLKCERGLRLMFQEDALQRGISFGRKGRWSKRTDQEATSSSSDVEDGSYTLLPLDQYVGRWIFLNTTENDFHIEHSHREAPEVEKAASKDLPDTAWDNGHLDLVTPAFGHPLAEYSEVESYLLDYFIQGIGPSCALSQKDNPYISLITPLCFVHSTLRNALLAAAGNQLRLLGDMRFVKETLIYRNRALNSLHQAISHDRIDDGVIATVLMLCFHDISDECDPSWVTQLHAGLQLLNHTTTRTYGGTPLLKFFTMYFVAHDIMGRTASQKRAQVIRAHSWTEDDNLDEIDMVMGCSRRLMSLIDDISNLAVEQRVDGEQIHLQSIGDLELNMRILTIRSALCGLKQTLPAHSADRDDLSRIAEIKRLTAILYLIDRLKIQQAWKRKSDQADPTHQQSTPSKRCLVSLIIRQISSLPDSATLLWPLFILGSSGLDNEDHRRFVLDRLGRMQRTRNLGSVRRARMAVKQAFQIADLDCRGRRRLGTNTIEFISLA